MTLCSFAGLLGLIVAMVLYGVSRGFMVSGGKRAVVAGDENSPSD